MCGRLQEAIAICSKELTAHPTLALALFLRGAARLELGLYGLALDDLTRANARDLRFARLTESLAGR